MLTEPQIRTISVEKKKRIPYGSGLHLELRPLRAGGTGKYWIGRTRYPVGGPTIEVAVGSWGKEPGQLSIKQAREEWVQLKAWALPLAPVAVMDCLDVDAEVGESLIKGSHQHKAATSTLAGD